MVTEVIVLVVIDETDDVEVWLVVEVEVLLETVTDDEVLVLELVDTVVEVCVTVDVDTVVLVSVFVDVVEDSVTVS